MLRSQSRQAKRASDITKGTKGVWLEKERVAFELSSALGELAKGGDLAQ